jgi:glycosyltransferase involved in cell wall biosynthesis
MKIPTISLVIPAYNEEKYIGECLRHALNQSGGSFFEIIVIDNASTDKTAEVAKKFTSVRVVREEMKGLTRARQRGLLEARGDVLAYADADTRMPPNWCETIVREFSADEKLACLSGPYLYYDVGRWKKILVWLYWHILALPVYGVVGYMTVGGNFAVRRGVLEKMNGFDTSIEFYGEDTNIARRAHRLGRVKFSLRFVMPTSGRRLAGQGLARTGILYVSNFISEVLFKKPVTKKYNDIR